VGYLNDRIKIGILTAAIVFGLLLLVKVVFFGTKPTALIVLVVLAAIVIFIKPHRKNSDHLPPQE
jgi:hypothetical protein